jgi:protein-tyrosine-phosphatase
MKELGSDRFEAFSAGVTPKGQVSPITLRILHDRFRIDASGARSKSWEEFKNEPLDFVVSVSEQAEQTSHAFPGCQLSPIGHTMILRRSRAHPKKLKPLTLAWPRESATACNYLITCRSISLTGFGSKYR